MIVIVSGLPRSGTSLAMQMLGASGMPLLTDGLRVADASNSRGYFEWEPVKQLLQRPVLILQAEGHAVKVVTHFLRALPVGPVYRVLLMARRVEEVVASQNRMVQLLGTVGAKLEPAQLAAVYRAHLADVDRWRATRTDVAVLPVEYAEVLRDPRGSAERIREFVGVELDVAAMAAVVDAGMYRSRA